MKPIHLLIVFFIIIWPCIGVHGQSANQNYIHTRTYTNEAGTTDLDQIQYFDGLGRPVQTVQKAITPGTDVSARKDLVTWQEYDAFGRLEETYIKDASGNKQTVQKYDYHYQNQ